MEDVIFNGTETRKALSVAEVTVTISNEAGLLTSIDAPEIVVLTGISMLESSPSPDLAPYDMGGLTIREMGSETTHHIVLKLEDLTTINEMSASF
jgi:hypothetical protein